MTPVRRNYWIAVAVLLVALPLPARMTTTRVMPLQRSLNGVDYVVGEWQGQDQHVTDNVRRALGTQDILLREYHDAQGYPVGLYVSYFARQGQGQVSHSPKHCLPGAGWQPRESRRVRHPLADGDAALVNEIIFEKAGERQLVYYWFRERRRIVASEYLVKWYLIWDALTLDRTDGALLRVVAPIRESEDDARRRSLAFMRVVLPHLEEFLPG